MFIITADQVDSRHRADIVDSARRTLGELLGSALVLPIDRTAGDEIQLVISDPSSALTAILALTRDSEWSVGCGVGAVSTPLPANAREAGGSAFVSAREAVEMAKKRETRFALRCEVDPDAASDTEALTDLLLYIRGRRSAEGWQLYDLMLPGRTQADAAKQLGITPQAASKRARAAAIRSESRAVSPLERMLGSLDRRTNTGSDA